MKKLFLLIALLAIIACEQDEFDEMMYVPDTSSLQTKATGASLSDFDPLKELIGLPLNIIHVKNSNYKYLSCAAADDRVSLTTKDDGSGRQRWYLQDKGYPYRYPLLTLKKGNNLCNSGSTVVLSAACKNLAPQYPILKVWEPFAENEGNFFSYINGALYFRWGGITGSFFTQLSDLQAVSDAPDLTYRSWNGATYPNENGEWMIVPVGEYKIIDIQYEKVASAGDYIIPKSVYCGGVLVEDSPGPITRTVSASATVESISTFTESSKVTTQNQSSFGWSFGIDAVSLVHIGFNGEIDNSIVNEQAISYETTERKSTTITESYTIEFPPHTPCRIQILKLTYHASLTYVMTLEKVGGEENGKRFRVKGKWDGVVLSDMFFKGYSLEDNTEIMTGQIPEGTTTIKIGS